MRHQPTDEERLGYLVEVQRIVDQHGVMIQAVFAPDGRSLPFTYTVGLHPHEHPELLMIGLDPTTSHAILNHIARRVIAGERFVDGDLVLGALENGVPLRAYGPVDDDKMPANTARALYGDDVAVLQLLWPDAQGRFGDDPAVSPRGCSPLLPRRDA